MRKCKIKKWIPAIMEEAPTGGRRSKQGTNCLSDFIHDGLFHQWGVTCEEGETNFGNQSVAIVEMPDGTIEMVYPPHVKFTEPPHDK